MLGHMSDNRIWFLKPDALSPSVGLVFGKFSTDFIAMKYTVNECKIHGIQYEVSVRTYFDLKMHLKGFYMTKRTTFTY